MRPRLVLVLVLVAMLLGGLWIFLPLGGVAQPVTVVTSPLSSVDAMAIQELSIIHVDGSASTRALWDETTGVWLGMIEDRQSFPLIASRVRGSLRLLDMAIKQAIQSEQESLSFRGATLHLRDASGTAHTLRFAETSLAGERLMLEENPAKPGFGWVRRVEASFATAIEQFQETLDTTIVPWEPSATPLDTIRVMDSSSGQPLLEVVRRGGAWVMTTPIMARADSAAIERTLQGLRRPMPLERGGPPNQSATPDESPQLTAFLELSGDIRRGDASATNRLTITCSKLSRESPFNPAGRVLVTARSSEPGVSIGWGSYHVTLHPDALHAFTSADALLSPRATPVAASDVASLALISDSDSWNTTSKLAPSTANEAEMILWSTSTAAAAQQLVALLTSESAVPTSDHGMLTLHTSDHECWRVELRSPAGKPLDVLALRALSDGGLAVRSGQVAWVYSAQQAETILTALRAAK